MSLSSQYLNLISYGARGEMKSYAQDLVNARQVSSIEKTELRQYLYTAQAGLLLYV